MFFIFNLLVPLFRPSLFRVVLFFYISLYGSSHRRRSVKKVFLKISQISRKTPVLESLFNKMSEVFKKICEVFKNTYFEEHQRMTASEFIGDTTLFQETILKKNTHGKTNFQQRKEYNRKQHFE